MLKRKLNRSNFVSKGLISGSFDDGKELVAQNFDRFDTMQVNISRSQPTSHSY
jgi:hypothetical protein